MFDPAPHHNMWNPISQHAYPPGQSLIVPSLPPPWLTPHSYRPLEKIDTESQGRAKQIYPGAGDALSGHGSAVE